MTKSKEQLRDDYLQTEARDLHDLATELNRLRKLHWQGQKVQAEVRRVFDIVRGIGSAGYERWSRQSWADL